MWVQMDMRDGATAVEVERPSKDARVMGKKIGSNKRVLYLESDNDVLEIVMDLDMLKYISEMLQEELSKDE